MNKSIVVYNTNASKKGDPYSVKIVKHTIEGPLIVAMVEMRTRDPLKALQDIVNRSKYLDSLSAQLRSHLNCEANPEGELTIEDFKYLQDEWGLKVQIC